MADRTILGLDLATRCGWAVLRGPELHAHGRENLLRKKEARGDRWTNFDRFLTRMVYEYNPQVLVYERVRRHIGATAAHVYGGLLAGLERFTAEKEREADGAPLGAFFNPEIVPIEISTWRKAALGKGNATKEEVVQWVKDTYGVVPGSHDEAEAIAIAEAWRRLSEEA